MLFAGFVWKYLFCSEASGLIFLFYVIDVKCNHFLVESQHYASLIAPSFKNFSCVLSKEEIWQEVSWHKSRLEKNTQSFIINYWWIEHFTSEVVGGGECSNFLLYFGFSYCSCNLEDCFWLGIWVSLWWWFRQQFSHLIEIIKLCMS